MTQDADEPSEESGAAPEGRTWSAHDVWYTRVYLPRQQRRVVVIDESHATEADPPADPLPGLSSNSA